MSHGFKATLFAGAITLSAFAPAFAAAPIISNLPDVTVGDLEDSTDSNLFVFSDAFQFSDYVADQDTTDTALLWSFGEFSGGLADSQYMINGVTAVNAGTAAVLADQQNDHENAVAPGIKQINLLTDSASFRDIILSPLPDAAPYPEPTEDEETSASAGKVIRYYVSDGTNVAFNDAFINTVNDAADSTSPVVYEPGYVPVITDETLSGDGWVNSGLAWDAVSTNKANGELSITVQPTTAKSRIYGWTNPGLMDYDDVGADKFVRGKFYVFTDVNILNPVNQVPNFRLRITHENAVNAAVHYELAQTGLSGTDTEPGYGQQNNPDAELKAGYWLRPADTTYSPTPSLYRLDFDPVDVPAAAGSKIGALMESYTISDTANGSLFLTEVQLGTYNALDNSGELIYEYRRDQDLSEGAGGAKAIGGGGFNHEASLVAGELQDIYLPGVDPGNYYSFTDQGAAGVFADTGAVEDDVFGVGLLNFLSVNNVDKVRVEKGKLYHARFYATAPVATDSDNADTDRQGAIRFRFQTAANTVSYLLDMTSLAAGTLVTPATPNGDDIAAQALPGIGSQNPDTDASLDTAGEDGGWYSVVASSPLDDFGIRNDVNELFETTNNVHFFFNAEPGPGAAGDSARDVTLGVDLIKAPRSVATSFGPVAFDASRAVVRISAVEVYEYPSIDDGGFEFDEAHP